VASLSEVVKPALSPKKCSDAGDRLPGVREDSAVRKPIQEQERPLSAEEPKGKSSAGREEIIGQSAGEGVGAARSSDEASNDRGAKGPQ
jgi:hypothetical protein